MDQSNEEDTALRDLVAQTLDARGVLPKIRAELRANVFLALEENPVVKDAITYNDDLHSFAKTENGAIVLNLIREFLDFFNLGFTLSVFNPETRSGADYEELSRAELLDRWGIRENSQRKAPVMCHVVDFGRSGTKFDGDATPSPAGLNATYTKSERSEEATPVRMGLSDIQEQDLEDISSHISESYTEDSPKSPEKVGSDHCGSPAHSRQSSISTPRNEKQESGSAGNSHSGMSTPPNEKANESVDLLVFTPVQQVKAVPKEKITSEKAKTSSLLNGFKELSEVKTSFNEDAKKTVTETNRKQENSSNGNLVSDKKATNEQVNTKETVRSVPSSLKDLPPLTLGGVGGATREKNIAEMRKLVEMVDFNDEFQSSLSLKNENKQKSDGEAPQSLESDRTINSEQVEDEEEDISDLLNSKGSSDGQLTADETLSRLTNKSGIDHIESV